MNRTSPKDGGKNLRKYFHSECAGCVSFGNECDTDCEFDDSPERCKYFKPLVQEIIGEEEISDA